MRRFIFSRTLAAIPVLIFVGVFVFSLIQFSAGDPAALLAGDLATDAEIDAVREELGLNESIPVQFWNWSASIVRGDLGTSIFSNIPVTTLFAQRVEPTVSLTICALVVTIFVAVPLGTIAAWKSGKFVDRLIMLLSVTGFSIPVFVVGYVLVYFFSLRWGMLPGQGFVSIGDNVGEFFSHMVLPTLALSAVFIALIARITRASILEVLSEDYIRTAHAKGASESRVLYQHALRNAAIPILTVVGIALTSLVSGVVIVETIFNIPGLGRLVVDAVLRRDYPVVQGLILVIAFAYVIINLLIDICYAALDPRIRY